MIDFDLVRELVRGVLERPYAYRWTVQGFGMLRTYLGGAERYRLNVWDDRLMVPGVSLIHDHPWDLESLIISGTLINQRYAVIKYRPSTKYSDKPYHWSTIRTGEDGGPLSEPETVWLRRAPREYYDRGDLYSQRREEVHATFPARGAVTLNRRSPKDPASQARVFWSTETHWVDAKPRPAYPREIELAVSSARALYYQDRAPIVYEPRFDPESCPGHVASEADPKICGRCGVNVDSFRPPEETP